MSAPDSITEITEEQQALALVTLAQQGVAAGMTQLSPKQNRWLKFRAMTDTDSEANHLAGKPRGQKEGVDLSYSMKPCGCREKQKGWMDRRENTVIKWKKHPIFRAVYDTMLNEPVIYAATAIEQAAPIAIARLKRIIVDEEGKVGDQRLASVAILQAAGLLNVAGVNGGSKSVVQSSLVFKLAQSRAERGLELSSAEKKMLGDAGVPTLPVPVGVRSLDGDLVELPD